MVLHASRIAPQQQPKTTAAAAAVARRVSQRRHRRRESGGGEQTLLVTTVVASGRRKVPELSLRAEGERMNRDLRLFTSMNSRGSTILQLCVSNLSRRLLKQQLVSAQACARRP